MSELTLTLLRLGLLVALWFFVFAVVGVLRGDLYGTRVTARTVRRKESSGPIPGAAAPAPTPPPVARGGIFGGRRSSGPRKIVVTEGPLAGTSLPLRATGTLIGRSPECALVLDDDYASGRHARIHEVDGAWLVEDLGSTNGTFVDNRRITSPTPLQIGTALRIGRTVVELQR